MDQPPAVPLTAFADAWPRGIEMEIGAALCAIGRGKDLDFDLNSRTKIAKVPTICAIKLLYTYRHIPVGMKSVSKNLSLIKEWKGLVMITWEFVVPGKRCRS